MLPEAEIARAPEAAGVYRLYRGDRVIFVGMALELRAALREHRNGALGPCTQGATRCDWQTTGNPVALQRAWLALFAEENGGRLPECNEAARKPGPR